MGDGFKSTEGIGRPAPDFINETEFILRADLVGLLHLWSGNGGREDGLGIGESALFRITNTDEDEGISLARLIDIFSRAGNPAPGMQWRAESGPINLQTLKP